MESCLQLAHAVELEFGGWKTLLDRFTAAGIYARPCSCLGDVILVGGSLLCKKDRPATRSCVRAGPYARNPCHVILYAVLEKQLAGRWTVLHIDAGQRKAGS
jgi:hypothetical protein